MKQRVLTYIDYGMGGVFLWILAPSPEEIVRRYPRMQTLSEPPDWMKPEHVAELESQRTYDIDADAEHLASLAR
jgi:hypothetical protein